MPLAESTLYNECVALELDTKDCVAEKEHQT